MLVHTRTPRSHAYTTAYTEFSLDTHIHTHARAQQPGEELLTSYIEEDAPFEERRSSLRFVHTLFVRVYPSLCICEFCLCRSFRSEHLEVSCVV